MDWISESSGGCVLRVKVAPRASKDALRGIENGFLCVRLHAPPVDGKANDALRGFFAETLGIPKRDVILLDGETGRHKRLLLRGVPLSLVSEKCVNLKKSN